MLHFSDFRKSYGSQLVLKIADKQISQGIFWLKGKNGAGKSTLLKCISGILYFDGDISLNKTLSLKKHPVSYRKAVNFAEAEPVFPPFLTGEEMIKLFSQAKQAAKAQVEELIETMKINSYVDDQLGTYSSGMLKKLSLVLAFLGRPKLVLLDEPLTTLDQDSARILVSLIAKENSSHNTSFILSSHQPLMETDLKIDQSILIEDQSIKLE